MSSHGYNSETGEYGDMLEAAIVDPTRATRVARQNAAALAGLQLTMKVTVADAPRDEDAD